MQDEKWENLLDSLEIKFPELTKNHCTEKSEDSSGQQFITEKESVEFTTPAGKMKLVRVTRPAIVDKKYHYTHTSGSKGRVEYILSETEKTHKITLFRFNEIKNDWEEINEPSQNLKF